LSPLTSLYRSVDVITIVILRMMAAFCFTGYGSVLNADGEVEMDAIIMEGQELKAGICSWPALCNLCDNMGLSCLCG